MSTWDRLFNNGPTHICVITEVSGSVIKKKITVAKISNPCLYVSWKCGLVRSWIACPIYSTIGTAYWYTLSVHHIFVLYNRKRKKSDEKCTERGFEPARSIESEVLKRRCNHCATWTCSVSILKWGINKNILVFMPLYEFLPDPFSWRSGYISGRDTLWVHGTGYSRTDQPTSE